jgi:hypothetical protein
MAPHEKPAAPHHFYEMAAVRGRETALGRERWQSNGASVSENVAAQYDSATGDGPAMDYVACRYAGSIRSLAGHLPRVATTGW